MTTLNITLSNELRDFVDDQARAGRFDGPAGYVQALIEQAKNGRDHLESLLIEGLDSGDPITLDGEEWARIHEDVQQRMSDAQ